MAKLGFTRNVVICLVVGGLIFSVACSSKKGDKEEPGQETNVALTDAGCDPSSISVNAGPTTFNVTNKGSAAVTELEVMNGNKILGEVENVAPSLKRSFTLSLKEGTYTLYCPGGKTAEKGTLTVKAAPGAPTTADPLKAKAEETYRTYLKQQSGMLVTTTTAFVAAVKAGNIDQAKTTYAAARPYYESIEPVAESFGDLDPLVDARDGDPIPDGTTWGGFHRLEKAIWADGSLSGMGPVADALLTNVTRLRDLIEDVELDPATIANGAVELLDEVSSSKVTGEEERYSHLDLIDFAANLSGSRNAFEAVRPLLASKDSAAADTIVKRFDDAQTALDKYKSGTGYVSYTQLSKDDTKKLANAIDAVAEPLSKVAKKVAS